MNELQTHIEHISHVWETTKFWLAIIGALLAVLGVVVGWIWRNREKKIAEAYNNSLAALDHDTDQERRLDTLEKEMKEMATKQGLDDLKTLVVNQTQTIVEFIKEGNKVARQQYDIVMQAHRELVEKYLGRAERAEHRAEQLEKKNIKLERELEGKQQSK